MAKYGNRPVNKSGFCDIPGIKRDLLKRIQTS